MVTDNTMLNPVLLLNNGFTLEDKTDRLKMDVRVLTYSLPDHDTCKQRVSVHFIDGLPRMTYIGCYLTTIRSGAIKTVGQLRIALAIAGITEISIT